MKRTTYMHDALAAGINARYGMDDRKTRRQQKHDLFLAFIDNAQHKPRPQKRSSILHTLLSVFL
jgi:hypothetical protein